MTEIQVDLNNATTVGLIRVNLARIAGPIAAGQNITIVDVSDPNDRLEATVRAVDNGQAVLHITKPEVRGSYADR